MELILESATHGRHVVLIDDWLWPFIKHWMWGLNKKKRAIYCERNAWIDGKQVHIQLSRFALGIMDSKVSVDHINHNTLDNRLCNLRTCTVSQNSMNKQKSAHRYLPFKGIYVDRRKKTPKYRVGIGLNYKRMKLSSFPFTGCGLLCAALAYDIAAIELHKDFACLNFPLPL